MATDLTPLWISLKTAGLATVVTFILGIAAAYGMLGDRQPGKSLVEAVFIAPLILPPTVVGFLLLLLFGKNGPLGKILAQFDVTIVFTWYAAVITATVVSFPLMYKTTLGAFEQVDRHLLQVAQTLGASRGEVFRRILLPLSLPGILAGTTLAFARSLGEFGATLMVAGNIPGQTQTIPMAIYFAVEAGAMGEAWLWVGIILVISLAGIMAANIWQRRYEDKIHNPQPQEHRLTVLFQNNGWENSSSHYPKLGEVEPGIQVNIQKQLAQFSLDVTFTTQGETVGLLGASGSGKTMTLRCIAGIETPTQGRIILNGRTLFDSQRNINVPSHERKVGLVLQNYALFPHLTVAQNIAFGLRHLSPQRRSLRVEEQLTLVNLEKMGDRYPHQLSGGQQQRVALARALAPEPNVLLLDEPFSALDTHLRYELEKQLLKILSGYKGFTLFVSHNLEEAYRICQKLLVLSQGKLVATGDKQAIFDRPGSVTIAQLTGCKNYSPIQVIDRHTVRALDWQCTLQTTEPVSSDQTHIGIRAHQIRFLDAGDHHQSPVNTFPGWVVWTSETPHRMTVYLKLGIPPVDTDDYHLQAEVFKEKWQILRHCPQPWSIHLEPDRLMLLTPD
ncbi:ABC transporter [Synechocystis sp. PCC 6803]|uniref:ABC transporter n=1 Tax=Synechocystis sp. (strain ATCC 27184 / PCC 6803 / Kazusa) TaxID=1111708 RepID=Q55993_SYNY3|nr:MULTISPECIES: molybdate ABC transporter permease subunit [unclassified Synechocystis]BAM53628.1 ABC transporter [Synechocystis sp. PCC 6803] [Bacillus subtilis BEST7613]AGF53067.1 ABC transporter [Synechocystis sp. PCC 6803]ALJ68949.1 maltoporin [Synechocystis sp. PCC 6803]AVP90814.1 molybdate ABC transporter permease subunit [Synechocystis sp. IPPAS B-1465]MBD2617923.1 molybdate ABC transporter permease subunit [Synechocystis sp. FACHB-898]